MRVLLTGAGGFLGQRVALSLLDKGATDVLLHYRQKPADSVIAPLAQRAPNASVQSVAANLLARGSLRELVDGVDCIVHAAAGMRGAAADMFANSVVGTRNLLEAACAAGVKRIVLISSFSVYRTEPLSRGAWLGEATPIEEVGTNKGPYGYAKTRQEQLFLEFQRQHGFETIVLRPGVIYGPGGSAMSPRVGIKALGFFFSLGGSATLPLSYVDNCADAVAQATLMAPAGSVFNVVDDDLPTCGEYLSVYRREVQKLRTLPIPYWVLLQGSRLLARYHRVSKGQLPAVFTPYVVRSMYRPLRYSNAALKAIGWEQGISTEQALDRSMRHWREQLA